MDQIALVKEQIEGGEKLVRKLLERGFDVRAAFWGKTESDGRPYLYLVAPQVDVPGVSAGYGEVSAAQAELELDGTHWMEQIDPFGVNLLSPNHPLARGVLNLYRDNPKLKPCLPRDQRIGSEIVDNAFIYPPSLFLPLTTATP